MEAIKIGEYLKNLNRDSVIRALLVTVDKEGGINVRFDNVRKEDFALFAAHLCNLAIKKD